MSRRSWTMLALLLSPGCATPGGGHQAEINDWHAGRMNRLRSETGMLTLVGLHPLSDGTLTLGSSADADIVLAAVAPPRLGFIDVSGKRVTFTADRSVKVEHFEHDPPRMVTTVTMVPDTSDDETTVLSCGSVLVHLIERGGAYFLRVRDRRSPVPAEVRRIERYPVDERWLVTATLIPDPDGMLDITNVLGQQLSSESPGVCEFELEGVMCRLQPTSAGGGRLFFVFADATTGTETYGGGRYLYADPPDADGRVVIDFNKGYNPYCAFTPYATCTVPTSGNTLSVAVRAGERYDEAVRGLARAAPAPPGGAELPGTDGS